MSQTTYTLCPPMPAAGAITTDDRIQLKGQLPVSVQFGADGVISSTGLSFNDAEHMHVHRHKGHEHYRTGMPSFMLDPIRLREVIVMAVEAKAFGYGKNSIHRSDSLDERLKRAEARIAATRDNRIAVLDRLLARYAEAKAAGDFKSASKLAVNIESLDTFLCNENHAATISAVLFLSYRAGLDSVGVSQHLGGRVKSPLVRQILRRCRIIAGEPVGRRRVLSQEERALRAQIKSDQKESLQLMRAQRRAERLAQVAEKMAAKKASPFYRVSTYERYRQQGLCVNCGAKRDSQRLACADCRKKANDRGRDRRKK